MMQKDLIHRYSNRILKIQLVDNIDFTAFKEWLKSINHQFVPFKNESGRFIVFFDHPPKELFKWVNDFVILRGATYLWHDGIHVNRDTYRTVIEEGTEDTPPVYSYLNWEDMTDVAPMVDIEE
jgi:hypothetical protein